MGYIFISYSHKDKEYVHKLQDALQKEGLEVWIDDRIDYGTRWPKVIQDQLDSCDAFIVVVSENSYESEWVQNEVTRAKRKGKPFFPLLLNGDTWLSVETTQYEDVTDGKLPSGRFFESLTVTVTKSKKVKREFGKPSELPFIQRHKRLLLGGLIALIVVCFFSLPSFFSMLKEQLVKFTGEVIIAATQTVTMTNMPTFSIFQTPETPQFIETSSETPTPLSPQEQRDSLLGIIRLEFKPVFSTILGTQFSHLAANETDLYLLDAAKGSIIRSVAIGGDGYEIDATFYCEPGVYGDIQVGPLVDILIMPKLNALNASVLGIDPAGNLLYCAPGKAPQAVSLPTPIANWVRIKSIFMNDNKLYVMDPPSRAIWIYTGNDGTFTDMPIFFFGNQIPEINDAIDFAAISDDLIILHQDGSFSYCSYSRIDSVPTRCDNLLKIRNPFGAYDDPDLFAKAQITQMVLTPLPDQSIFLLDVASKGVLRISPHTMELQAQYRSLSGQENPFSSGSISAMTISSNHVLFIAIEGQVYFSSGIP